MLNIQRNQTQKTATCWVNRLKVNHALFVCFVVGLLGAFLPSWAGEGQTIHASKDTFVRISNNGPWGNKARIRVDNDGGQGTRKLVGIVQFRHNPSEYIDNAKLHLDVETFTNHADTASFSIWGMIEEDFQEDWDEDSDTWNDFDLYVDGSDDCVNKWQLFGEAPLGQFTVSRSDFKQNRLCWRNHPRRFSQAEQEPGRYHSDLPGHDEL